jgi:hypothetical protein
MQHNKSWSSSTNFKKLLKGQFHVIVDLQFFTDQS